MREAQISKFPTRKESKKKIVARQTHTEPTVASNSTLRQGLGHSDVMGPSPKTSYLDKKSRALRGNYQIVTKRCYPKQLYAASTPMQTLLVYRRRIPKMPTSGVKETRSAWGSPTCHRLLTVPGWEGGRRRSGKEQNYPPGTCQRKPLPRLCSAGEER